jgi:hypothetical protein
VERASTSGSGSNPATPVQRPKGERRGEVLIRKRSTLRRDISSNYAESRGKPTTAVVGGYHSLAASIAAVTTSDRVSYPGV